jgi:hypothetical protein
MFTSSHPPSASSSSGGEKNEEGAGYVSIPVTHWMAVGEISEAARQRIKASNGTVRKVDTGTLSLYVVGIPCELLWGDRRDTDVHYHRWTRSQEGIIEVPSTGLKLSWLSAVDVSPMEASASDTMLDVWQERD